MNFSPNHLEWYYLSLEKLKRWQLKYFLWGLILPWNQCWESLLSSIQDHWVFNLKYTGLCKWIECYIRAIITLCKGLNVIIFVKCQAHCLTHKYSTNNMYYHVLSFHYPKFLKNFVCIILWARWNISMV